MATYGYDGRHLFSFDGEFHYEGVAVSPNHARQVGEKEIAARLAGSYFLSGQRLPAFNVWADGEQAAFVVTYWRDGAIQSRKVANPGKVPPAVPVCVSGPIVENSEMMAQFCATYPSCSVFACPVVDELAAFGVVAEDQLPRRIFLAKPCEDELPFSSIAYDDNLEGDAYGRMAAQVKIGRAVHNQMYVGPGASPFHGVLTLAWNPERPLFMVRANAVTRYFPEAPISAKYHAATTVPIMMPTSEEFREETGCDREKVEVMVESEFIPGVPSFMKFHHVMSGKDWVGLTNAVIPLKTMPLFRYNKAYKVPPKDYLEILSEPS
jgi:hypothetical protein